MQVSDLIGIGRLGGLDARGFFQALIKPGYRSAFKDIRNVFLIFNSDRVFYVSISEREVSENKIMIRFAQDGIAEERRLHREAIIAIEPDILEEDSGLDYLLDWEVLFEDQALGKISDYFFNNAHYVIVVRTVDERELLVPWVDYYIQAEMPNLKVVLLANLQPLLAAMDE